MKINFRLASAASLALLVSFASCKKGSPDNNTETDAQTATAMKTHSDDYNAVTDNVNETSNDISLALEASASISGRTARVFGLNGSCSATVVVDSSSSQKMVTITYEGSNCAGTHSRTGSIKVTAPADLQWRKPGAAVTVQFLNVRFKRKNDNKSITFNGTQTITNVSGGLLINLPTLQSIVHTITSNNMSVTFDDSTQRTWNVSRKRTFTYENGVVLKITGTGVSGNATNLTEWGNNRAGQAFTTAITEPLTFRQDCDGRLTSGQIKHEGFGTLTASFGLGSTGEPTTCPGNGKYYLKLVWVGANTNPHSLILPY